MDETESRKWLLRELVMTSIFELSSRSKPVIELSDVWNYIGENFQDEIELRERSEVLDSLYFLCMLSLVKQISFDADRVMLNDTSIEFAKNWRSVKQYFDFNLGIDFF